MPVKGKDHHAALRQQGYPKVAASDVAKGSAEQRKSTGNSSGGKRSHNSGGKKMGRSSGY